MSFLLTIVVALAAFFTTLIFTPLYIYSARQKGIVGRDVNKAGKPEVVEMGGFALFAGLIVGVLAGILALTFLDRQPDLLVPLLASLGAVTLLALIGVFDGLFRLSWRTKAFIPVVGSFPLVAVKAGQTAMSLPFLGAVDFGLFYNFLLVPLGVTGAANAVNMSAGYNGLEAGIGVITSAALLYIALSVGSVPAAVLLAACLGACLAFLKYNWFPAKVFPGDIGTLVIGATLAAAVIIGNMEKFGVIVLLPAFYELFATVYYIAKKVQRRALVHSPVFRGGLIIPPKGAENYTLAFRLLAWKPMRESTLVLTLLGIYALFGILALALFHFGI